MAEEKGRHDISEQNLRKSLEQLKQDRDDILQRLQNEINAKAKAKEEARQKCLNATKNGIFREVLREICLEEVNKRYNQNGNKMRKSQIV